MAQRSWPGVRPQTVRVVRQGRVTTPGGFCDRLLTPLHLPDHLSHIPRRAAVRAQIIFFHRAQHHLALFQPTPLRQAGWRPGLGVAAANGVAFVLAGFAAQAVKGQGFGTIRALHTQGKAHQVPVLGALILGSVILVKIIDKYPLGQTILFGLPTMLVGALIILIGLFIPTYFVWTLIIGMTIMSFGEGICFSVLYRLAMMSSDVSKGTVASAMSMIMMFSYFVVLEVSRMLFEAYDLMAFSLCSLALVLMWFTLPRTMLKKVMLERKEKGQF